MEVLFSKLSEYIPFRASIRKVLPLAAATARTNSAYIDRMVPLFVDHYNLAIQDSMETLMERLSTMQFGERGAVLEGAFAGLATLDFHDDSGWRRVRELLASYQEMPAVTGGIGAALSHMNVEPTVHATSIDEFWAWSTIDAYGFHQGYFKWSPTISEHRFPDCISGLALHPFDEGLGRAIWIISYSEEGAVAGLLNKFPRERRASLWSGAGMMLGYLGGYRTDDDIRKLIKAAKEFGPYVRQGIAFAAWIRKKSYDPEEYTTTVCRVALQKDWEEVGEHCIELLGSLQHLPQNTETFNKWMDLILQNYG
jgi:hypothetical protein